jgi:uncharacterized protein (TIGR02246 family)
MPDSDLTDILAVRAAFVSADRAGNPQAMTALLTDDVVILHPDLGAIDGREAVTQFVERVLMDIAQAFTKHVEYSTIELEIAGRFAFERGRFHQELVPRAGGAVEYDNGQYLWLYAKGADGAWKIARIAGALEREQEEEE